MQQKFAVKAVLCCPIVILWSASSVIRLSVNAFSFQVLPLSSYSAQFWKKHLSLSSPIYPIRQPTEEDTVQPQFTCKVLILIGNLHWNIYIILWNAPSATFFLNSILTTLARSRDQWDKVGAACYGPASPCVFPAAPETWCNQAHRGERECVWFCEPAISSAADDQVGGERDLEMVQKGQRATPQWVGRGHLFWERKIQNDTVGLAFKSDYMK